MNSIKKIASIAIIFFAWNIWNSIIYDNNEQNIVNRMIFCLQGFKSFNKQCMGWLLLHLPILMFLTVKMSRYVHNFSIYYYIKKGNIKKLWQENIWISFKMAFFYYSIGFFFVLVQLFSNGKRELPEANDILVIIEVCVVLAISAVTFTFLVLLIESFTANFQLAFSIAIIVQIVAVIISQNATGEGWYLLSHTDIKNQFMNNQSFINLLLQNIIEMIVVIIAGFVITRKRFENLMECE